MLAIFLNWIWDTLVKMAVVMAASLFVIAGCVVVAGMAIVGSIVINAVIGAL